MEGQKKLPIRSITPEETKEILALEPDDITRDKLIDLFGHTLDRGGKARFNPSDTMIVPNGFWNKKPGFQTTVGRFIFNTFIIKSNFYDKIDYINTPVRGKDLEKFESKLSDFLIKKEITPEVYADYLNRIQWLGFTFSSQISPSASYELSNPLKDVMKRKKELLEEHKEEIKAGNAVVVSKIESELLDMAKSELKDSPSYDLYDSSAAGNFKNHYKNMQIMKGIGPVLTGQKGFKAITNSYMEGLDVQDIPQTGDNIVMSAMSRAVETRDSGYAVKQALSAYQSVALDKEGSDCHTDLYIKIKITPFNKNYFKFRYIVENGKLVLLDEDHLEKVVGKTVKLRSPMTCKSEKICSKCAGELMYSLGTTNIGLLCFALRSKLFNYKMKLFHDATLKVQEIDPEKWIGQVGAGQEIIEYEEDEENE